MDLFSFPLILFYSALFGITMKLADLVDEHGKHWFKGDALLFGLLWGFFGSLLVLGRNDIANVTLAMVLAFLIRMRLDYFNHALAAAMIIITFLWVATLDKTIFPLFLVVFIVFGSLRDYLGDVRKKKDLLYRINEPAWYYVIPPFLYAVVTANWYIFWVFTVYIIFYNAVKAFFKQF